MTRRIVKLQAYSDASRDPRSGFFEPIQIGQDPVTRYDLERLDYERLAIRRLIESIETGNSISLTQNGTTALHTVTQVDPGRTGSIHLLNLSTQQRMIVSRWELTSMSNLHHRTTEALQPALGDIIEFTPPGQNSRRRYQCMGSNASGNINFKLWEPGQAETPSSVSIQDYQRGRPISVSSSNGQAPQYTLALRSLPARSTTREEAEQSSRGCFRIHLRRRSRRQVCHPGN